MISKNKSSSMQQKIMRNAWKMRLWNFIRFFYFLFQVYVNKKWETKTNIEEPYKEGCENSDGSSQYCHCRGNLCNSAPKVEKMMSHHTDAMAVIFVFNLMKYIRNMEY